MVLGLMDFLLGGKKKTKVPKTAQVTSPSKSQPQNEQTYEAPTSQNVPDGVVNPTENVSNPEFVDSKNTQDNTPKTPLQGDSSATIKASNPTSSPVGASGGKKSVSEVIHKLHSELKESGEKITGLVTDFKALESSVSEMGHRVGTLEESKKVSDEKFLEIDEQMTKFLSLYELINNQYNPFIDQDSMPKPVEKIQVTSDGSSESADLKPDFSDLEKSKIDLKKEMGDLDSALLELDTLNIEEAAADAVPLTHLKNNTNSLVIILSWLEYLIKRVGMEETRNTLRYYTEVLRWITPEVYFELDKYLKGMKDKKIEDDSNPLNVKDHIVSLYFISKLNEKKLDDKLTSAVLQIIKQ